MGNDEAALVRLWREKRGEVDTAAMTILAKLDAAFATNSGVF
jgi:hypothetical protein